MLALVVAVALSQCTKDTDCKGDRICAAGECIDLPERLRQPAPAAPPVLTPSHEPSAEAIAGERVRILKIARLEGELRDLHEQLEDNTFGAPIIKLAGALALTGVSLWSAVSWSNYRDCDSRNFSNCGNGDVWLTTFVTSTIAAVVLYIWGGLQLRLRILDSINLPKDIEIKTAELAQLRAQRL